MIVFFALLGALALAGAAATVFEMTYTGSRKIQTRYNGSR